VTSRRILPAVRAYRNNPAGGRQDATPRVLACEEGTIRIEVDDSQYGFAVSEDSSKYWIGHFQFPRPETAAAAASEESASSPMPGQVLRILVEPGREVHPGDPLVILEAMKMEQTVRAHAEGVVDAVLVKAGQVVAPGETLVHVRAKEQK
jgi:biotin carboxyl carrier protein